VFQAKAPMSDLSAIVEAHSEAVWRTVFRLLDNYDDALDCYQETFLDALRAEHGSEVRHWRALLVKIATRRAMDRLRQRYAAEKSIDIERVHEFHCASSEPPDGRAQGEELRQQVRRALAGLPQQQAEAFWLRHLEQLDPDEIAHLLGIEAGHVRVLAHRAALALRSALGCTYGPAALEDELP
jgi:RNA polymerase sigma-70 factor, ECF subfamily